MATNGDIVRPKVLCPEKLSEDGLKLLEQSLQVDQRKGLSPEELISIIGDYDALLVRSETKVTAELMQAAKNLKIVARAGVGVDNVDVPAATKLGIVVVNSPQGNIQAAAEHTIALIMSMARNIPDACASTKAGKWERSRLVGVEVKGKVLGIIGLGKGILTPTLRFQILIRLSRSDCCQDGSWSWNGSNRQRSLRISTGRRCQQRDSCTDADRTPTSSRFLNHPYTHACLHQRNDVY